MEIRSTKLMALAMLIAVAAVGTSQVLQSESFESGFVSGELDGQSGWIVAPGGTLGFPLPDTVRVQSSVARTGNRGVEVSTSSLLPGEALYAYRPLNPPIGFGTQGVVLAEAWVRFGSDLTGGRRGIISYDATGTELAGLTVDASNGAVFTTWLLGAAPIPTLAPNTWHRFTLVHEMLSGRVQGFLNSQEVAPTTGGFVGANFSDINLFANGDGSGTVFFDDVRVERVPLGALRGRVHLGDFTGSPLGRPVQIRMIHPSTGVVSQTINTSLSADGEWSGIAFVRGSYNVQVKPWHWTSKTIGPRVVSDIGLYFLQTPHANGDVDGSDEVDAADIDRVIQDFGLTGVLVSDVDGSDEVDAADIDIVISNFGAIGD